MTADELVAIVSASQAISIRQVDHCSAKALFSIISPTYYRLQSVGAISCFPEELATTCATATPKPFIQRVHSQKRPIRYQDAPVSLVDEIENRLKPNAPSADPLETGTVVQSKRKKERDGMKKGANKAMISARESKYKLKQTPRKDNSCGDKANHGKNRRGGETDRRGSTSADGRLGEILKQ